MRVAVRPVQRSAPCPHGSPDNASSFPPVPGFVFYWPVIGSTACHGARWIAGGGGLGVLMIDQCAASAAHTAPVAHGRTDRCAVSPLEARTLMVSVMRHQRRSPGGSIFPGWLRGLVSVCVLVLSWSCLVSGCVCQSVCPVRVDCPAPAVPQFRPGPSLSVSSTVPGTVQYISDKIPKGGTIVYMYRCNLPLLVL